MRCIIVLTIIGCLLIDTVTCSSTKADQAHSEVMSYAQENMGGIRMMRGNRAHLECFNGYLPLINSFAIKARDVSNACVIKSNFEKDQELSNLQSERLRIAIEVEKISKSLSDCSQKFGLQYFECLQDNAETNKKLMELISEQSRDLMNKFAEKSNEIDVNERSCIMRAVDNAKAETDQAYVDLKDCIKNGPVIETQIDEIGQDESENLTTIEA